MTESPTPLTMLFSRHTRRREFIAGLGSAAVLPVVARAQQDGRVRWVGVLMGSSAEQSESQVAAFELGLRGYGWMEGRNVRIDYRWSAGNTDRIRANVAELLSLNPDVVLISGARLLAAMQQATRIVPLVFVGTIDRWHKASSRVGRGQGAIPRVSRSLSFR